MAGGRKSSNYNGYASVVAGMLVVLFHGCGPSPLISETTSIDGGKWAFTDVRQLKVIIDDTLTPYNHYILVRHGGKYSYRNLIVMVKTFYPNKTYKVDTVDCPMADKQGRWLGTGLGDLIDNRILFKMNQRFPLAGEYKFELQHAMRPDTVHEIYDIGLEIEPFIQ
ncbi:MAG: hypothetical protein Kow0075_14140 [Salibacteraceae bacterium]